MISIDKNVFNLLKDAPRSSVVEIFFFIAVNQPDEGICGFRTSKKQLIIDLNSSQTSVFRDLKWLKENILIQEIKLVETSDFMANPYFVMNNADRNARIAEWNRRLDLDSARKIRLRKQKRLREARKDKKQ